MNKSLKVLIAGILLFAGSLGITYGFFTIIAPVKKVAPSLPPQQLSNGSMEFDNSLPKTEACPLNGTLYSTQQKAWWEKHAPLGVMIENSTDARPQSG
ncbi:MAG TPA: hypothetical protein VF189_00005, partial [Patescibacteria group bacterium]